MTSGGKAFTATNQALGADSGESMPVILLVEPQLGDNIGATARAMLNFGLSDLRLVRPRDGWPNGRARATSSGADVVIDAVRVFPTTAEALADVSLAFATTGRDRAMAKPVVTPGEAARQIRASRARTAFVFGSERFGLSNEDIALCDAVLTIPTNPDFASLNLGQAVLLSVWSWFAAGDTTAPQTLDLQGSPPASKEELFGMFAHLERELDIAGFLFPPDKREVMVRNLRNMFTRAQLSDQEVRTMRGVITALVKAPHAARRIRPEDKEQT